MSEGETDGGEQVFLVSSDPEHFERTISEPVDLGEYDDLPDPLSGVDSARLWVVPDGTRNEETFERMLPGDLVLFYHDGQYVGVGRIGATFDDGGWVAGSLWEAEASSNAFTVTDFVPLAIGRAAVNRLFDYGGTYVPQGLMRVSPDRVTATVPAIELAVTRFDERQS